MPTDMQANKQENPVGWLKFLWDTYSPNPPHLFRGASGQLTIDWHF